VAEQTRHEGSRSSIGLRIAARWGELTNPSMASLTLDERIGRLDERLSGLRPRLATAVRWMPVSLLIVSIAVAFMPVFLEVGLSGFRATAIVVISLTVVPTALEILERIHNNLGNRYRGWTERRIESLLRRVRRRRLARLFAQYGREVAAGQTLPSQEAAWFSVAAGARRVRRWAILATAFAGAVLATLFAYLLFPRNSDSWNKPQEQFALGSLYTVVVTGYPTCQEADESKLQRATCSVGITVRNVSRDEEDMGPGSFGPITSYGPYYGKPNDYPYWWYATAAVANGNYYRYDSSESTFAPFLMQPGESSRGVLVYSVPFGVKLGEVVFSVKDVAGTIHVTFTDG
jgi:hypothetical protein